jgi:hypothetical protein
VRKFIFTVFTVVSWAASAGVVSSSLDAAPDVEGPRNSVIEGGAASGHEDSVLKKIRELEALRTSDPAAYRAIIQEKKERLQKKFETMRSERPGEFQAFLDQRRDFEQKHLENIRRHHPEAYEKFRGRLYNRMRAAQEKHPERFRELLADRPGLKEKPQMTRAAGLKHPMEPKEERHAETPSATEKRRILQAKDMNKLRPGPSMFVKQPEPSKERPGERPRSGMKPETDPARPDGRRLEAGSRSKPEKPFRMAGPEGGRPRPTQGPAPRGMQAQRPGGQPSPPRERPGPGGQPGKGNEKRR